LGKKRRAHEHRGQDRCEFHGYSPKSALLEQRRYRESRPRFEPDRRRSPPDLSLPSRRPRTLKVTSSSRKSIGLRLAALVGSGRGRASDPPGLDYFRKRESCSR
jgi:hypothetical protein